MTTADKIQNTNLKIRKYFTQDCPGVRGHSGPRGKTLMYACWTAKFFWISNSTGSVFGKGYCYSWDKGEDYQNCFMLHYSYTHTGSFMNRELGLVKFI